MLNNIASIETLFQESATIGGFLETPIPDEPEMCLERGNRLASYLARTSKMLADAKYHKDKALANSIIKEMGENAGIPASVLKQLVDAACKEQNYLVNLIERLNRTATHQLDWMRTIISKAKEERRATAPVNVSIGKREQPRNDDIPPNPNWEY